MKNLVKTPWYEYYENIREHLDYPTCSIYKYVEKNAKEHMNNICYNYYGNKVSYKKFLKQVDDAARSFKMLGVNYKDKVSICMPNTPEGIIAFYALNKIGAVANMIHPLSSESEIKYYLELSESKYIVTIDIALEKVNNVFEGSTLKGIIVVSAGDSMPLAIKCGYKLTKGKNIKVQHYPYLMSWKEFIKIGKKYDKTFKSAYDEDDEAVILYSGGTTGLPKGIVLTNKNFNCVAVEGVEICDCLDDKDRLLGIMPIFHGFGLCICVHTVLTIGATCILLPTFDVKTFDQLMKKYKPTVIAGVPTLYEALLLNKNFDGMDLSYLKIAISGGDSLSISLKKKLDKFFKNHGANIQIREGYGLTECVTGTCLTPKNYYREGSIGIPYPDVYYKIVKPGTQHELKYGEEGEIVISGPSVMKGYLKNKKETESTLKKHKDGFIWLHTGDIGFMDPDGFIYFKQRLKRVIMSSGYCVYPYYIENIIDSDPGVLYSCVIGIPHPYKVEVAKAFIVMKNKKNMTDEYMKKIRKLCEDNLAKYSWPYEYEFRESLPKTLVGKVAYKKLMEEEAKKRKELEENK